MSKQAVEMVKNKGVFEIVTFDITEATIAQMAKQYANMEIIDTASYKLVSIAIADVRDKRVAVEARRKELKKEALAFGKRLDGTAKRITNLLLEVETPLKATKKVEDDRKEEIRQEKARKEQARIDGIRAKIDSLKKWVYQGVTYGKPSGEIKELISLLEETVQNLSEGAYQEFLGEVQGLLRDAIVKTKEAFKARLQWEKEEEARKAEAVRLAEIQKQQEEIEARQRAEQEKIEAEKRKLLLEKAKIEAGKKAEAERKEREERERKIKEEAGVKAKADAEKQIQEAKEKIEREAQEAEDLRLAKEAETKMKAEMAPDREKLIAYAEALDVVPIPKIKATTMKAILSEAIADLQIVTNRIIRKAKELS